jgi:hypothetical protein
MANDHCFFPRREVERRPVFVADERAPARPAHHSIVAPER